MSKGHNVRAGRMEADGSAIDELKQQSIVSNLHRGKLFLKDDAVVLVPSQNESSTMNLLDVSIGPIRPLRTLGIYNPYDASINDSVEDRVELPFEEITEF